MKILVLGGSLFVGRHIVEAALAGGHEVSIFNRGVNQPDLFTNVEKLRGDRDGDLESLKGRRWDAVIDVSAYFPRIARATADLLKDSVDHYTFISTVAVYNGEGAGPDGLLDENATLATIEDDTVEARTLAAYGPLKTACERTLEEAMPGRVLSIRPGILVGPEDYTDRMNYWPRRIAQGGEVLAPGRPDRPVQFIDARDLAAWTIRMVEARKTGIYNASGPKDHWTMQRFLEACREVTGSDATFTWLSEEFLNRELFEKEQLSPMNSLLLVTEDLNHFNTISSEKAYADGLTLRPLSESIRDTFEWDKVSTSRRMTAGIPAEKEAELLTLWKSTVNV